MAKEKKQFTELSDEELKQVTGGAGIDCSLPENKDNERCQTRRIMKELIMKELRLGDI